MKISSFNEGTLIKKHNHLEYVVNKDSTHADKVSDFEYDLTKENKDFFEVKDINEEKGSFHIVYNLDEDYKSFSQLKKENRALKLSLMKHLLNVDPLKREISYLHPMNVYFKNIENIKLGFRGHRLLPQTKVNNLEQYKLLIMSTLSKYSFDRYSRNKFEALAKEKDTFLYNVNNANNLEELKEIVNNELNEVQTEYLINERERKSKEKSQFIKYLLASVIAIAVITAIATSMYLKNLNTVAEEEIAKAEKSQNQNSVYQQLYNGNKEEKEQAINNMKENEDLFDKEEVLNALKKERMYEELIKVDPDSVPEVIEELYSREDVDKIRELSFTFEDNEILSFERKLIDDDVSIFHSGNEGHYEKQNKRFALKAVDNNRLSMAKSINDELNDKEVSDYIKQREIANKEREIKDEKDKDKKKKLEKELEELKK